MSTTDVDSLPLHDGWATISTAHAEGLRPQDLEGTFGPRSAVIVLKALADALLSESINADMTGSSYRSVELDDDNRYEEVLAMHQNLQSRIEVEEQEKVTQDTVSRTTALGASWTVAAGSSSTVTTVASSLAEAPLSSIRKPAKSQP